MSKKILIAIIFAVSTIPMLIAKTSLGWDDSKSRAQKIYGDAVVTKVISVYDGDTFRANIAGLPPIIGENMPIRLGSVDTPEIRD